MKFQICIKFLRLEAFYIFLKFGSLKNSKIRVKAATYFQSKHIHVTKLSLQTIQALSRNIAQNFYSIFSPNRKK